MGLLADIMMSESVALKVTVFTWADHAASTNTFEILARSQLGTAD
jgi:hypothetical protein